MGVWIEDLISSGGYLAIIALMFTENVFPPIPSELVMPFAGYVSSNGELTLWGVIIAGGVGSVLGALPFYYLGRWAGMARLKRWTDAHGHWLMLSRGDLEKAESFFGRHGVKTVFLARLVPGLRSVISIPAGMCGMNLGVFLRWTALGTTLWAGLLAWLGYLLGRNYGSIERYLGPVTYLVLGGLLLWYVVHVVRAKRAKSTH